jgi:hypothetical protein
MPVMVTAVLTDCLHLTTLIVLIKKLAAAMKQGILG